MPYFVFLILAFLSMALPAAVYEVDSPAELRRTLPLLQANDTLKIAPGTYPGGQQVRELAALTIEGMDAKNPPLFTGGNVGWHFIRTPGLTLRHLHIRGMKHNGVNLDDGGKMTSPVAGITLEHLNIEDIGPDGNFDAIKCSGLQKLAIRHCQISGWGGQAIDLVGCREVRISECEMRGKSGFSQHTGPQFKGGCEDIILEKCRLIDAGPRPIQVGGSTGEAYFRPPGATWEARRVTVRENLIEGGQCATAFTGCTEVDFRDNRIVRPEKWLFRILQETRREGFLPCGQVRVSGNRISYDRKRIGGGREFNIGGGTAPESFVFENNTWLDEKGEAAARPAQVPGD